jgi:copper(I)-binding protein
MKRSQFVAALAFAVLFGAMDAAPAHDAKVGAITIDHPWAPSLPNSAKTGIVYATIVNRGAADRIVGASTAAAARVELHTTLRDGATMRMRPVDAIPVPMGGTLALQPNQRFHLMLIDLAKPLREGESFPLRLVFEKAGAVDLVVQVEKPRSGGNHHH